MTTVGRPTSYTPELGEEICDAVATSSKGVKQLCKENEHWPSHNTIYRWLSTHKEFGDLYARAKKFQITALIDEILEIADDTSRDTIVKVDDEGNERTVCNSEWINRSRLKIDTRKWLAAKLCPRLYGERPYADPAKISLPEELTNEAVVKLGDQVLRGIANQEMSIDEGKALFQIIESHVNIVVGKDLLEKAKAIQNQMDLGKNR